VSLLKCQLSEGAVSDKNDGVDDSQNGAAHSGSDEHEEIEEGELPDSHGEPGCSNFVMAKVTCLE
jgi:endoribonuclease Dicer